MAWTWFHRLASPPHVFALAARLAPWFDEIRTEIIPLEFNMPTTAAGAVEFFRTYFGPVQTAFKRLDAAGQAALAAELEQLWAGADVSREAGRMLVPNEYLHVTGRRD